MVLGYTRRLRPQVSAAEETDYGVADDSFREMQSKTVPPVPRSGFRRHKDKAFLGIALLAGLGFISYRHVMVARQEAIVLASSGGSPVKILRRKAADSLQATHIEENNTLVKLPAFPASKPNPVSSTSAAALPLPPSLPSVLVQPPNSHSPTPGAPVPAPALRASEPVETAPTSDLVSVRASSSTIHPDRSVLAGPVSPALPEHELDRPLGVKPQPVAGLAPKPTLVGQSNSPPPSSPQNMKVAASSFSVPPATLAAGSMFQSDLAPVQPFLPPVRLSEPGIFSGKTAVGADASSVISAPKPVFAVPSPVTPMPLSASASSIKSNPPSVVTKPVPYDSLAASIARQKNLIGVLSAENKALAARFSSLSADVATLKAGLAVKPVFVRHTFVPQGQPHTVVARPTFVHRTTAIGTANVPLRIVDEPTSPPVGRAESSGGAPSKRSSAAGGYPKVEILGTSGNKAVIRVDGVETVVVPGSSVAHEGVVRSISPSGTIDWTR